MLRPRLFIVNKENILALLKQRYNLSEESLVTAPWLLQDLIIPIVNADELLLETSVQNVIINSVDGSLILRTVPAQERWFLKTIRASVASGTLSLANFYIVVNNISAEIDVIAYAQSIFGKGYDLWLEPGTIIACSCNQTVAGTVSVTIVYRKQIIG